LEKRAQSVPGAKKKRPLKFRKMHDPTACCERGSERTREEVKRLPRPVSGENSKKEEKGVTLASGNLKRPRTTRGKGENGQVVARGAVQVRNGEKGGKRSGQTS